MRFMVIGKATPETEKEGAFPDPQLLLEVGKYNEELMKAGVLLASDGLHPSSKGARVKFSGKSRTVIDGPFTESKELIAGLARTAGSLDVGCARRMVTFSRGRLRLHPQCCLGRANHDGYIAALSTRPRHSLDHHAVLSCPAYQRR